MICPNVAGANKQKIKIMVTLIIHFPKKLKWKSIQIDQVKEVQIILLVIGLIIMLVAAYFGTYNSGIWGGAVGTTIIDELKKCFVIEKISPSNQ